MPETTEQRIRPASAEITRHGADAILTDSYFPRGNPELLNVPEDKVFSLAGAV